MRFWVADLRLSSPGALYFVDGPADAEEAAWWRAEVVPDGGHPDPDPDDDWSDRWVWSAGVPGDDAGSPPKWLVGPGG